MEAFFEKWLPALVALFSLGALMVKMGQWKTEREDVANHHKEKLAELADQLDECVQRETCNARQAEMKAVSDRALKTAHDVRDSIPKVIFDMKQQFIPRETVELQLKSINERLERLDDAASSRAEDTNKRLLSIETHLRAIRQNGNGVVRQG